MFTRAAQLETKIEPSMLIKSGKDMEARAALLVMLSEPEMVLSPTSARDMLGRLVQFEMMISPPISVYGVRAVSFAKEGQNVRLSSLGFFMIVRLPRTGIVA